jgi:undecaprenyl-diphosphatase
MKGQNKMKQYSKRIFITGNIFIFAFVIWTVLIQKVDIQPIGLNRTNVGFATFNGWFHQLTEFNMTLYNITDWLGLVPLFICMVFGVIGFVQLVKRKSLLKVDFDISILGIYYVIVILCYLIFEMIPINYRPIFINGFMEASYPSSTTLLVLGVMPTLVFQAKRRIKSNKIKKIICVITILFSAFMVVGRLVSGVHWITDIVGSVLLSMGLFYFYKGVVLWNSMKNFKI